MSKKRKLTVDGLVGKLAGNNRKIYGFRGRHKDKFVIRNIGDVWYEEDPATGTTYRWEQKKGYRTKQAANMEGLWENTRAKKFWNCPKEECTCIEPNRLDEKFRQKVGQCSDCHLQYETMLKINGEFEEYARKKMRANMDAWFKDAEADKEALKKNISKTEFVHDDGRVEKWEIDNLEEMLKKIDDSFEQFKINMYRQYGLEENNDIVEK